MPATWLSAAFDTENDNSAVLKLNLLWAEYSLIFLSIDSGAINSLHNSTCKTR